MTYGHLVIIRIERRLGFSFPTVSIRGTDSESRGDQMDWIHILSPEGTMSCAQWGRQSSSGLVYLSSLNTAKKCFAFKMGWIITWSFFTDECGREMDINNIYRLTSVCWHILFTFVYTAYSLNSTCYGLLLRYTPSWMLIVEWRAQLYA